MKPHFLVTIGLAVTMSSAIHAQEPLEELVLDLQSAIDYAVSYNKSLQNARQEVERSRATIWESISQGLPLLSQLSLRST